MPGREQEKIGNAQDFLTRFYQSPEEEFDNPVRKAAFILLPEKLANRLFLKNKTGDSDEGGCPGSAVLSDSGAAVSDISGADILESAGRDIYGDMFKEDTLQWKEREKRELSKRTKVSLFLLLVMIPVTVLIGMYFFRNAHYSADQNILQKLFGSRIYYFLSLVIMIYAMIPFFMVFEGRKPQARELVVLATMVARITSSLAWGFLPSKTIKKGIMA